MGELRAGREQGGVDRDGFGVLRQRVGGSSRGENVDRHKHPPIWSCYTSYPSTCGGSSSALAATLLVYVLSHQQAFHIA